MWYLPPFPPHIICNLHQGQVSSYCVKINKTTKAKNNQHHTNSKNEEEKKKQWGMHLNLG